MDPTPTESQQELRAGVRDLLRRFDLDYWARHDRDHAFPWEFYDALAGGGWLGITVPEQYGGGGLGISEAALLLQEIAASGAAMNGCSAVHLNVFGLHPVVVHGSEELRARVLPRAATGELHVCFGVTEPDAGTDTSRITTRARREGDTYVVTGRKIWTSKAQEAEKVLLLTRTTPREECERPTDGMTLLLADLDRSGARTPPAGWCG